MNKIGLYRDEMAKFVVKNRRIISNDSIILKVKFPMLPGSWGEDFVPLDQFPKSFCVMTGKDDLAFKPYTPINFTVEYMDLLIKMYPEGKVSKNLFDLKEGETIFMKGPREKLKIEKVFNQEKGKEIKRILMFAGGTGIAPMLQVLKFLIDSQKSFYPKIILSYCNKSQSNILLEEELEDLKNCYPEAKMEIRHILEDQRGFINEDDVDECNGSEDYVLICGPRPFNEFFIGNSSIENEDIGVLKKKRYNSDQIFKF